MTPLSCTRQDPIAAGESFTIVLNISVPASTAATSVRQHRESLRWRRSRWRDGVSDDPDRRRPDLTIAKMQTGNFTQGQTGATYTITVTNTSARGATSGTVTVTDTLPDRAHGDGVRRCAAGRAPWSPALVHARRSDRRRRERVRR